MKGIPSSRPVSSRVCRISPLLRTFTKSPMRNFVLVPTSSYLNSHRLHSIYGNKVLRQRTRHRWVRTVSQMRGLPERLCQNGEISYSLTELWIVIERGRVPCSMGKSDSATGQPSLTHNGKLWDMQLVAFRAAQ